MTDWETIDFKPAPPGWRIVCSSDDKRTTHVHDMPGWLTQRLNEDVRVIATYVHPEDGELVPAVEAPGYQCVIGPTEPVPTTT